MILAAAVPSVPEIAALIGIVVFALAGLGGAVAYLARRRETTGSIRTSDAAVLWDQSQKMRAEMEAQRDKAVEQRDRLIDSQSSQVLPVLQMIIESLRQITDSLARLEGANRG